jgi:predicted ATPase/class 3 adenylate cyclase
VIKLLGGGLPPSSERVPDHLTRGHESVVNAPGTPAGDGRGASSVSDSDAVPRLAGAWRAAIIGAVRGLPSGTVTFLFTDIEGSTRLLGELGERYADVLAEHNRILREAFSRHDGREVGSWGDSFFVAFVDADSAVAAAGDVQATLAGGPVQVRIGIHTGEAVVTDEGYVGLDVNRAARIMSAGHGGQILLSETTRQLLEDNRELVDLGEHRLKDLGAPHRLFQVGDGDFPPLRTLYRTNLPIQPTPLVGRRRELAEAGDLIRSNRLVTLTGPGGSGKTRLALQVAADAVELFPDGVFWVPLQAVRDPAIVERAIRTSVGADDGLIEYVANKRLLVLLDNFEQVVEAAPAVSALVGGTPHAKVLVTSREPLHVESERRYPVEPLRDAEAEILFVERGSAVAPGFRPTPAVGEICRRLDGLPLAIELAAARLALLDPDELLARLDRRLPLLAGPSRDAPARQRTLRSAIEWSHELLEPDEQQLFGRLAVFAGSFALDAAETVCDAELDLLESLVEKSLVRRWSSGRLGMLDTIREYALERLDESSDGPNVRLRHAEYFLAVAESANLSSDRLPSEGQHFHIAIAEQDNLRAALAWALETGSIALGLQLATAIENFWVTHDAEEATRWFAALLDHPGARAVPPEVRAPALRAYGSAAYISGEADRAMRLWEESFVLFEQVGDVLGRAVLLHRLGVSALQRGELHRARELTEASDELYVQSGEAWGRVLTVGVLGAIARDEGDKERAFELMAESADLAHEFRVLWWEAGLLAELAALSLNAGRVDDAERHARESLALADELHDRSGRLFGVGLLACVAAEHGDNERAGVLWGSIEEADAVAPLGGWRAHRRECEAQIGRAASPEFERGRATGRELTLDAAVAHALAGSTVLE